MSKNIVLCLDGTWNGPDTKDTSGDYTPTNVQKVFENLKGSAALTPADNEREVAFPDAPGAAVQVAKYIHGIGDISNVLAKACEGATGIGLIARIIRGYTYLSRQYQTGDAIYIAGFSRGAYTARALAGLVVHQGLLDWNAMKLVEGSETSYSAALAAWQQYKKVQHADDHSVLHGLADLVASLHDEFELGLHPAPELEFVSNVGVCAVGVWDTVGALGVPDIYEQDGTIVRKDVFEFVDTQLSPLVANGFHAVAIDEQRVDFSPTLWDVRDGVVQVLFPGAHADVGGGYAASEAGLANAALAWMVRQLASVGVQFERMPPGTPDPLDVQHRPWVGGTVPFATALRHFPPGMRLSQRVIQRVQAPNVPVQGADAGAYRPVNIVNSYLMLDFSDAAPHVQVES